MIDYAGHVARMERQRAQTMAARWAGQGERPEDCAIPWPPSLDDAAPLPCQLPRGHVGPHYGVTPWSARHSLEWDA